jgi:predicted acylesterase/phospholipase RssA
MAPHSSEASREVSEAAPRVWGPGVARGATPRRAKPLIDRTNAVNSLRKQRLFRNASLRLLSDLVEVWHERSTSPRKFEELPAPWQLVRLAKTSFSLFWSLRRQGRKMSRVKGPRAHLLWICADPGLGIPVEALAQLLAAAIADTFQEHVAVVTCTHSSASIAAWNPQAKVFEPVVHSISDGVNPYEGIPELNRRWNEAPYHLLFVPPATGGPPHALVRQRCHRVIYLADEIPDPAPMDLQERLMRKLRAREPAPGAAGEAGALKRRFDPNADPYFSSFIVTVVRGAARPPHPAFSTRKVDDEFHPTPRACAWRLERDHCRLTLDLAQVRRAWDRWARGPQKVSFPAGFAGGSALRSVQRWARAVTNRQAGLALSGGGAASYRMIPLLRQLEGRMPVDVVSGVSGGALLAAYYCKDGLRGLNTLTDSSLELTTVVLRAVVSTAGVEAFVDRQLGSTQVDDLDVRFVALTTALSDPPEGRIVVHGTLGEAVRVSGAAPLGFAPTRKGNTSYTDGAAGTPIPARILKDYGADFVVACNCVAGPRWSNPFREVPLLGALHALPIAGRLIDFWVYEAFMLQQISRETGEDAHEYIEPMNTDTPFRESIEFWNPWEIISRSERELKRQGAVERCINHWREFVRAASRKEMGNRGC